MGNSYSEYVVGRRNYSRLTQTAATLITRLVEPDRVSRGITRISSLTYRVGADNHILTVMRPFNRARFTADSTSTTLSLSADPGVYNVQGTLATANNVIAANDYVVYEAADGTFVVDLIASGSGTAPVLTTAMPTGGVKKGGLLWFYGLITDTNPNNNQAHLRFNMLAGTTVVLGRGDGLGSIPDSQFLDVGQGRYQPLILQSDNATSAGFLESVGVEYVEKGK